MARQADNGTTVESRKPLKSQLARGIGEVFPAQASVARMPQAALEQLLLVAACVP